MIGFYNYAVQISPRIDLFELMNTKPLTRFIKFPQPGQTKPKRTILVQVRNRILKIKELRDPKRYKKRIMEKKKDQILKSGSRKATKESKVKKCYSIKEVGKILSVSRQTIYKWLSLDEPEDAIIPPEAWFRLPSGHIRIREWVVLKIQNREI
jgi:hypothetical protein